jgi:hypothetical protein
VSGRGSPRKVRVAAEASEGVDRELPGPPCDLIGTNDERLESLPPATLELGHRLRVERLDRRGDLLAVGADLERAVRRPDDLERRRRKPSGKSDCVAEAYRPRACRPRESALADDERIVGPVDLAVELRDDPVDDTPRYRRALPRDRVGADGRRQLELRQVAPLELRQVDEDDGVPLTQARDPGDARRPAPEGQEVLQGVSQRSCGSIRP